MDIRKFFTPSGGAAAKGDATKKKKKDSPISSGNGLAKERQLDLSPSKKQTKSFELGKKKPKHIAIFSSDDSDGESPISNEIKKTCITAKRIESDEEEDFHSASTSKPMKKVTPTKSTTAVRRTSFRDDDSSRDSNNSPAVERRTARKVYDEMAPLNEVFTNKKRKGHQPTEETAKKPAIKRPKCDVENKVPENVANEMFTTKVTKEKKTAKQQAADVKLPERPRNPKIDKITSPPAKAAKPTKRARFEVASSDEADEIEPEPTKPIKSSTSPATKKALTAKEEKSKEKKSPLKVTEVKATSSPVKQPVKVLSQPPKSSGGSNNAAASQRSALSQQSTNNVAWVDKYKPSQLRHLIGQLTDKSPFNRLLDWLREWPTHNLGSGEVQKKGAQTVHTARKDGTPYKAALLSGPPGIGKTTCAVMACRHLNLRIVETNASDTRSKKTIDVQVSGVLDNQQINHFFTSVKTDSKVQDVEQVLIMDEVDGMSGNQDRAGMAELIQMIKRTKVPIICICNDRQSSKIRSLANYCFDLRFSLPRVEQIRGRLMTIVTQEKIMIDKDTLEKVIEASNQDIRQCINSLQMMAADSAISSKFDKKNVAVGIFEAARRILSRDTNIFEKQELFFSDYSIMPLFVHENYVHFRAPRIGNAQHLRSIRQAAECMAFGDIIEKQVRSTGAWNLLVEQAMYSCALPAVMMDGLLNAQIQFPSWFGKMSNEGKRRRLMRQLASHTHRKISGSTSALVTDYLPIMRERLYRPLIQHDADGVREVVEFYKAYDLVRDDMEAINDLGIWPNADKSQKDISQRISSKTKATLTRTLNKVPRLLPFTQGAPVKGRRKGGVVVASLELDEEGHEVNVGGAAEDEDEEEEADQ